MEDTAATERGFDIQWRWGLAKRPAEAWRWEPERTMLCSQGKAPCGASSVHPPRTGGHADEIFTDDRRRAVGRVRQPVPRRRRHRVGGRPKGAGLHAERH